MGTPMTAAKSTVSVSLTDSSGLSASQTFTIVIPTTIAVTCTSRGNESVLTASAPFAFLVKGIDANRDNAIAIAGSFTPNGDGTIKASSVDYTGFSTGHVQLTVNLAKSGYSFGSDNRGCLTLSVSPVNPTAATARKAGPMLQARNTPKQSTRAAAVLAAAPSAISFSFVLGGKTESGFQSGRIIEVDGTTGALVTAGMMHVQSPAAFTLTSLQPNYAFGVDGWDAEFNRIALAGTFMNSSGTLSGGVGDFNDQGFSQPVSGELDGGSGSINATIDASTGRGTGGISFPTGGNSFVGLDFAFYVINESDFYVVSTDSPTDFVDANGLLSGRALATKASFTPGALDDSYLLAGVGIDPNTFDIGRNIAEIGNFQASSGGAIISGNVYLNNAGGFGSQAISAGTYVTQVSGRTAITATGSGSPVAYLTGPSSDENIIGFFVGTDSLNISGAVYRQTTGAPDFSALNSSFAMGSEGDVDGLNGAIDGVFTFDGHGNYSATLDNAFFGAGQPTQGQTITGTLAVNTDGSGILSFPSGLTLEGGASSWAILTNGTQIFAIDNVAGSDPLLYVFTIEEQPD
ncbi:MAG: hypothetical protein WB985_12780 [Candidatus Acidiferrales bacterium]